MSTENDTSWDPEDIIMESATYEQQKLYWTLATIITGLGLMLLFRFFYEYSTNSKMRQPAVNVFIVTIFGDIVFLMVYFPYHLKNVISVLASEEGEVYEVGDSVGCIISWYFASFSIVLELVGLVLIAYYPYKMVKNSTSLVSTKKTMTVRVIARSIVGCFIFSNVWFFLGYFLNQVGSFRGLYCAATDWGNLNGVIMFACIAIALSLVSYFYYHAYRLLRKTATESGPTVTGGSGESYILEAARAMFKFGALMIGAFLLCYLSFGITAFGNVVGYTPPMGWEIASGLAMKSKTFVVMLIMYSMPAVRYARQGQKKKTRYDNTTLSTNDDSNLTAQIGTRQL